MLKKVRNMQQKKHTNTKTRMSLVYSILIQKILYITVTPLTREDIFTFIYCAE